MYKCLCGDCYWCFLQFPKHHHGIMVTAAFCSFSRGSLSKAVRGSHCLCLLALQPAQSQPARFNGACSDRGPSGDASMGHRLLRQLIGQKRKISLLNLIQLRHNGCAKIKHCSSITPQCVWGVLVLKVYGTHDCILVIINVLIMPFMTR